LPTWIIVVAFIVSLSSTLTTIHFMIPLLSSARLTGEDLNKLRKPDVPEMGGLGTIVGISAGFVLILGANAFLGIPLEVVGVLGVFATVLAVGLIGVFDDLLDISQFVKALTPALAATPLIAINAGVSMLKIPLFGNIELGVIYPLILVPLGITGAANAFNMLAGFNGMETGVGLVAAVSLSVVAWLSNSMTAFLMLIIAVGALMGTLYFNWFPAQVLIGDVGTLTIGAIIASAVIVGDFEMAGLIIVIPHFVDFLFKTFHGLPSGGWGGEPNYEKGVNKLRCPGKIVGLPQFIMKITGGIAERNLTLVVMGLEAVAGLIAITIYAY